MRLSWLSSSRAEDRFEKWFAERHRERVLSGETTPIGPCPDESFLRDLAGHSKRIELSDPRVDHAATCPTCMGKLLAFREEDHLRQRKLALSAVIATCVVIAVSLFLMARYGILRQPPPSNMASVSRTVDLSDAGTIRDKQQGQLQSVTLPRALVRVTIILPRFSPLGQYAVAVTRDRSGNGVVAQGSEAAFSSGDQEEISVDLDLRQANAGAYFLSTTHEQDQSSSYYPLEIK